MNFSFWSPNANAVRRTLVLMASSALSFAGAAPASECAANIAELRTIADDPSFPLRWQETSMTDGKPLTVTITEKDGSIFLEFVKRQEGLWAEGTALICRSSAGLEARMTKGLVHLGPAAHWILRHSIGRGGTFVLSRLATGELRIARPGWHGVFLPKPN